MRMTIYPPSSQGIGAFDGGNITEQKPIGTPYDGSSVMRVGPLFYWAWAFAKDKGFIGLHPHQAFEIMTYVIQGTAEHQDTLGTQSIIGPGGVQMMHTGSGVSHQERFVGPDMEGFQIWFEPELNKSVKRTPSYHQYEHDDFPLQHGEGFTRKTILGTGSPLSVTVDAKMWDINIQAGHTYTHETAAHYSIATLAIRGDGTWDLQEPDQTGSFSEKDFLVGEADNISSVHFRPHETENLRIIIIEVPTHLDYSLYPKG